MPARGSVASIITAVLVLAAAAPAIADHEPPPPWPRHDRIYLMAAGTEYLHWTVDPTDPELDQGLVVRHCGATRTQGIPGHSKPCLTGGLGLDRTHNLYFVQASLFETRPAWSPTDPLRFHFELEVDSLSPYDVRLVLQQGTGAIESPPATEVSPGVWEGELGAGGPLGTMPVEYLGVRISTQSQAVTMRLKTGGESWIELPEPVGAKGVPDLVRDDTYAPAPNALSSDTHTLRFNDEAWESWSFTGDAAEIRTFDLDLPDRAVALYAWADLFDTPFLYDVRRGRPADVRKVLDGVGLRLLRDGAEIEHGDGPIDAQGVGTMAGTSLLAGSYELEVHAYNETDDPLPYTAHVVAVYGDRTLASIRSRAPSHEHFRLPVIAACPRAMQAIPVTPEVTTFHMDLDWETDAPGVPSWTIRYDMPQVGGSPCSEGGIGDNVRFTVPGERVWFMGATPAYDSLHVSPYDTVFDFHVRYTYTAPPEEHDEV